MILGAQKNCLNETALFEYGTTTYYFAGFPQALEIMENLEDQEKKFHTWKNHGI